jgi:hypothetical protein
MQTRCFLSEGLRRVLDVLRPSPAEARLSWSCSTLQSFFRFTLAPALVERSLLALCPDRVGFKVFTWADPRSILELSEASSLGLVLSYRVLRAHSSRFTEHASRRAHRSTAPPMRFAPLQRLPARGSSMTNRACLTRLTCARRFSRPLDAFICPVPAGLVSCRIRSWGCTLQSFVPPAQPYAVSDAVPLMSLGGPGLPARRRAPKCAPPHRLRRPPSPTGVCSTRESATNRRLFRPTTSA